MAEIACTFKDGQIYWRGVWQSPERAIRLAEQFERVTDWFAPDAAEYARQIRRALDQHEHYHSEAQDAA